MATSKAPSQKNQESSQYKSNTEAQMDLAQVEKLLASSAQEAFPMIKIKAIASYDVSDDNEITAIFQEESGIFYVAILDQDDPNLLLQRYVQND